MCKQKIFVNNFFYAAFFLILLFYAGCAGEEKKPSSRQITEREGATAVTNEVLVSEAPSPEPSPPPPTFDERLSFYVGGLTIEEKIGQLFCCAFRQGDMTVFNEEMRTAVADYKVGGVVLFAENLVTEEQTVRLIEDLQEAADIPLFVAVDEEGGRVSRLAKLYGNATPSAGSIGETGDTALAYEEAAVIGQRLSKLGFNLDFAPVADVNTNPANTVIGDRAYGSDPALAGEMVVAAVAGLQDQQIGAVLKHFPGHGDTKEDSHEGRAYVNHDLNRLMEVELTAFSRGIEAGALGVMVGHISAPNVTGNREPAVFSSFLLEDILKDQMNFDGILFTDAMNMGAVTNHYGAGEAAAKAFEAGIDVVVMPENLGEAYDSIKEGLDNGRFSVERLNESVKKVIKTKYILGLYIDI